MPTGSLRILEAMRNSRPVLGVIFGAGASYDSASLYPAETAPLGPTGNAPLGQRPPLTNDLFSDEPIQWAALRQFPEMHGLVDRIRPACRSGLLGFEEMVSQLINAAQSDDERRRRSIQMLAARFYLRELITHIQSAWLMRHGGVTTYLALLDHLESWRADARATINLYSFNYDTLLDDALIGALPNRDARSLRSSVSRDENYRMFKLHGSVDWDRDLRVPASSTSVSSVTEAIQFLSTLDAGAELPGTIFRGESPRPANLRVPAIAVPAAEKAGFEMPAQDLDRLPATLAECDALLVIGWAAKDAHFRRLIKDQCAAKWPERPSVRHLLVIDAGQQAQTVQEDLAALIGIDPASDVDSAEHYGGGFSGHEMPSRMTDWFVQRINRDFL